MLYFIIILLTFLAVIGACYLYRGISAALSGKHGKNGIILIEPLSSGAENAEYILRKAASEARWLSGKPVYSVICLDCGMDSETRRICELICSEYGFMRLCSREELCGIINETTV